MRSVPGPGSWLVVSMLAALGGSLAGCAALLDWSGFSDGGESMPDAAADDEGGQVAEGGPAQDSGDATDAEDDANDANVANDGGSAADVGVDGMIPRCGITNGCEGCCNAAGECVGGRSTSTCGALGQTCVDCSASGQVCDDLGMCVAASADAGPPPSCVATSCPSLCIPFWQGSCCKTDNTCGCEVVIPPSGTCM